MTGNRKPKNSASQNMLTESKAALERAFIEEYLISKGHSTETLLFLTRTHARRLRIEASIYASGKLAEIEARSKMVNMMHAKVA